MATKCCAMLLRIAIGVERLRMTIPWSRMISSSVSGRVEVCSPRRVCTQFRIRHGEARRWRCRCCAAPPRWACGRGRRDGRGAGSTHRKAWPCPRRCFRLMIWDANGAIGCHRGGASSRGVVGFNSGFGHRAHVLSVLGGDGMEPRTWGFPRGAGRSGRSVVVGKRRAEFSNSPAQLTKNLPKA